MATLDQQFIEYIIKSLVGHPDDVVVDRLIDEKGVLLTLTVNPEDLGRVIGKRGVTAQSLRTLLRALGTKNDARYNLKIENNDDQRDKYETSAQAEGKAPADDQAAATSDDADVEPVANSTEEPVENDSDFSKTSREELAELDDLDI